jgi:hypothetical protein
MDNVLQLGSIAKRIRCQKPSVIGLRDGHAKSGDITAPGHSYMEARRIEAPFSEACLTWLISPLFIRFPGTFA